MLKAAFVQDLITCGYGYPRFLSNDRRFSIFAESSVPIMHHAIVVIFSAKGVDCFSVVLIEVELHF